MFPLNQETEIRALRWLLNGACAVVLFGLLFTVRSVWLTSLTGERQRAERETEMIHKRMTETEQISDEHDRLTKLMQSLQDRAENIRARIPDQPNEGEFLHQATQAAEEAGVSLDKYRRGKIILDGDHSKLEVHMSFNGKYSSICRFIDRLERLPRISRTSNMILNHNQKSDNYPVELTLTLFFRSAGPAERIARAFNE